MATTTTIRQHPHAVVPVTFTERLATRPRALPGLLVAFIAAGMAVLIGSALLTEYSTAPPTQAENLMDFYTEIAVDPSGLDASPPVPHPGLVLGTLLMGLGTLALYPLVPIWILLVSKHTTGTAWRNTPTRLAEDATPEALPWRSIWPRRAPLVAGIVLANLAVLALVFGVFWDSFGGVAALAILNGPTLFTTLLVVPVISLVAVATLLWVGFLFVKWFLGRLNTRSSHP